MKTKQVVFLDWGYYSHKSIFSWCRTKIDPAYTALNMIIGDLRKFPLSPDDIIIIALDSTKGNWRKDLDPNYKADRKEKRAASSIPWERFFADMDELLMVLNVATPFHQIQIDKLEADDIIAYGVRYWKNNPVVIVSSDSDFEQLYAFDNCRVFSPISKKFKKVKNPYEILSKKIKREASDNLTTKIVTEEDYNIRKTIVNLLELPKHIESAIAPKFKAITPKEYDVRYIPYPVLKERFNRIFET